MFDINKFDQINFNKTFHADIAALKDAEKITKATLQTMSRYLLDALHTNEDIRPINAVLSVLTPVNKKVATEFFKVMTGFSFDADLGTFTEKSKKRYDTVRKEVAQWLEDPMNNIWSWADRHIDVKNKDFDLAKVTKQMEANLRKAEKAGFGKAEVLKAALAGGFTMADVVAVLKAMAPAEEAAPEAQA